MKIFKQTREEFIESHKPYEVQPPRARPDLGALLTHAPEAKPLLTSKELEALPTSVMLNDPVPVTCQQLLGSCVEHGLANAAEIRSAIVNGRYFNYSRAQMYMCVETNMMGGGGGEGAYLHEPINVSPCFTPDGKYILMYPDAVGILMNGLALDVYTGNRTLRYTNPTFSVVDAPAFESEAAPLTTSPYNRIMVTNDFLYLTGASSLEAYKYPLTAADHPAFPMWYGYYSGAGVTNQIIGLAVSTDTGKEIAYMCIQSGGISAWTAPTGAVPASRAAGTELWAITNVGSCYSSPAYVSGVLYVGSDNHNLYALNATTGAILWSYATGDRLRTDPTVVNGIVYVGSDDGYVYAINTTTHALVWRYKTGGAVESSPTVVNGIVYVGSNDKNVYAFNATTGAVEWTYATGAAVFSSPTVSNGVVYVGSEDNNFYAINATTGALVWEYTTGGIIQTRPIVANGMVYFGSGDGNFYALNAVTGTPIWTWVSEGTGSSTDATTQVVDYIGMAPETMFPYTFQNFDAYVPANVLTAAAANVVTHMTETGPGLGTGLTNIKGALNNGYPVLLLMPVFYSFEHPGPDANGDIQVPPLIQPPITDPFMGGHGVCAIGYDDTHLCLDGSHGALFVKNSWGTTFGIAGGVSSGGYFWMPYTFATTTFTAPYFGAQQLQSVDGIYDSFAFIADANMPLGAQTSTTLTASASTTTPAINTNFTISGVLHAGGNPLVANVELRRQNPANWRGEEFTEAAQTTGADGSYSFTWSEMTANVQSTFVVEYGGTATYAPVRSSPVVVTPGGTPSGATVITGTVDVASPPINENFTISGVLTYNGAPVSGQTVILQTSADIGTTWTDGPTTTTDANGAYHFIESESAIGTFYFRGSFAGGGEYSSTTTPVIIVTTGSGPPTPKVYILTIAASITNATTNQYFTINGELTLNGAADSNQTVTLQHSTDNATWTDVTTAITDTNGNYSISTYETIAGTYYYQTTYESTTSPDVSVTVIQSTPAGQTTITISVPSSAQVGAAFTIIGTLSSGGSPIVGGIVTLQTSTDNATWVNVTTTTTDANGGYVFSDYETSTGTFYFRTTYAGG